MHHSRRAVELLLVGDDPDEAEIAAEALRHGKTPRRVTLAHGGTEALRILAGASPPDLILLLPHAQRNGHDLLAEVKSNPELRHIPVMVLGDSHTGGEIDRAYNHHANCYVRTAEGKDGLAEAIRSIDRFWLDIVTLPPR